MAYVTQQKVLLQRVLEESNLPLTAPQLLEKAREEMPNLGMATVYRILKQFHSKGLVRIIDILGTKSYYEMTGRHHHFFFCERCEKIFSLTGCIHGIHSLAPQNFRAHHHEIVLYGDCEECLINDGILSK